MVSGYDPPYVVALVELDDADGVRLLANVLGCEPGDVHIGSRVVPAFEERGPVTLPQFRLAGGAGAR